MDLSSESDTECSVQSSLNHRAEPQNLPTRLYLFFILMFQTLFRVSDAAINVLLSFFALYLQKLAILFHSEKLKVFASKLPCTVHCARVAADSNRNNFTRYICCSRCFSIYRLNSSVSEEVLSTCTHVAYPNHPQPQHRRPCGNPLYKRVRTLTGRIIHRPILVYCYKSIIDSLQEMIDRPGFVDKCEHW